MQAAQPARLPPLTITKSAYFRLLLYPVILAGFGNTVLRTDIESDLTLYRLLAPLALIVVFLYRPLLMIKGAVWFIAFAVYGYLLARNYGGGYDEFIPSLAHYLYLFALWWTMRFLRAKTTDFDVDFMRLMSWTIVVLWACLLAELAFGFSFPNLYEDTTGERALRAWYWNQNDVAVVVCMYLVLLLPNERYGAAIRTLAALATIWLLYYNDSKAALISLVGVTIPVSLAFAINKRVRVSPALWWAVALFAMAIMALPALAFLYEPLAFANQQYTLADLFYEPLRRIFTLQTTGEFWGSINNRTDATISVLIEYFRSFGLGLGPGGSWLVLSLPQYQLGGAKSPHNALLQLVVDFGLPILLGYAYLMWWALRRIFRRGLDYPTRAKVLAIVTFPILGLSQSGAIVTNYAFWAMAFHIWLLGRSRYAAVSAKT